MSGDRGGLGALLPPGELSERFQRHATGFLERAGGDERIGKLPGPIRRGLARVLATSAEAAGLLASRALVDRLVGLDADYLRRRSMELAADAGAGEADLEQFLDRIRLLRRQETVLAACIDLGGGVAFDEVSHFLSVLAESIVRRGLATAQLHAPGSAPPLCVIAMGKLAGREFTYQSDLDLLFLYDGGPEDVAAASRVGQRLTSTLTTMTGAGVAYAVDARLRPSGHQGMLVTSLSAFERYHREQARIWEHLALLRARAVAGEREGGQQVLDRLHAELMARRLDPWPTIAELRRRVEQERARESGREIAFKTGRGGLMDVDFLAAGGLLERGYRAGRTHPSVPAMLRAVCEGAAVERLLEAYRFLRLVEARTRWLAGRSVESLSTEAGALSIVAELVEPGSSAEALAERIERVRREVRASFDRVIGAGTIGAL